MSDEDTTTSNGNEESNAQNNADMLAAKSRIAELEEQVAKLTDMAGRAQADLQNYKARADRVSEELRFHMTATIVHKFLPVMDDVLRLGQHLHTDGVQEGYEHLTRKLDTTLVDLGIQRIQALGSPVDPHRHEVLNVAPGAKDMVTAVYEDGYELFGKMLRPAKVQAGNGEETDSNL